jgi:hypothetical protein
VRCRLRFCSTSSPDDKMCLGIAGIWGGSIGDFETMDVFLFGRSTNVCESANAL